MSSKKGKKKKERKRGTTWSRRRSRAPGMTTSTDAPNRMTQSSTAMQLPAWGVNRRARGITSAASLLNVYERPTPAGASASSGQLDASPMSRRLVTQKSSDSLLMEAHRTRADSTFGTSADSLFDTGPTPSPAKNPASPGSSSRSARPVSVVVSIPAYDAEKQVRSRFDARISSVLNSVLARSRFIGAEEREEAALWHPGLGIWLDPVRRVGSYVLSSAEEGLSMAVQLKPRTPFTSHVEVRVDADKEDGDDTTTASTSDATRLRSIPITEETSAGGIVASISKRNLPRDWRDTYVLCDDGGPLQYDVLVSSTSGQLAFMPCSSLKGETIDVILTIEFVDAGCVKSLHFDSNDLTSAVIASCIAKCPVPIKEPESYGIFLTNVGRFVAPEVSISEWWESPDQGIRFMKRIAGTDKLLASVRGADSRGSTPRHKRLSVLMGNLKGELLAVASSEANADDVIRPSLARELSAKNVRSHRRGSSAPAPARSGLNATELKKLEETKVGKQVRRFLKKRSEETVYLDYNVVEFVCNHLTQREGVFLLKGLYRVSAERAATEHLWASFCIGEITFFDSSSLNAHIVTSAFKLYLRELVEPLIPFSSYEAFVQVQREFEADVDGRVERMKALVDQLHPVSGASLHLLCQHLAQVCSHSDVNLMTVHNVSIVFGPTLLRPKVESVDNMLDNDVKCQVVSTLVEHHERVFADVGELGPNDARTTEPMSKHRQREAEREAKRRERERREEAKRREREQRKATKSTDQLKQKLTAESYDAMTQSLLIGGDDVASHVQLVASCMAFRHKLAQDKRFRKHVRSQPTDTLVDMVDRLASWIADQTWRNPVIAAELTSLEGAVTHETSSVDVDAETSEDGEGATDTTES